MGQKWSKIDHLGLAYHVTREARKVLAPELNVLDLLQQEDGKREIVRVIYNTLRDRRVRYALEPRATARPKPTQEIRTPSEILGSLSEGTCLDLALLFCGVCLACELIPVLIVLEGHALVAVSLNHGLHDWDRRGKNEDSLFKNALVTEEKAEQLLQLIEDGDYLPVECTGASFSQSLTGDQPECTGRDAEGALTFERAVEAGRQQFDPQYGRPFRYAIDVAVAHCFHEMEPVPVSGVLSQPLSGRIPEVLQQMHRETTATDPLPYLLDRSEQEMALRKAALYHRAGLRNRPLICVIHGDEEECHSEFILRLQEISLPKILEYWHPGEAVQTPILKYRMTLPMSNLTGTNWEDVLWEDLAAATIANPQTSPEGAISGSAVAGVINFVTRHRLAVMIDMPLLTEKLEGVPADRIDRLFKFWDQWQNLPKDLLLIVCVSFKYQRRYEVGRKWHHMFTRSRGLNDTLREYVRNLSFDSYENLYGVSLPELRAIPQSEAEDAVNHTLISGRYGLTDRDVRRIYQRAGLCLPDGRIPMDKLLQTFEEVLKNKTTART